MPTALRRAQRQPGRLSVKTRNTGRRSSRHRVLLADPCRDTLDSMTWLLNLWGYDAIAAETGPEAIAFALAKEPDAILMEIRLPGLSGWRVAEQLRSRRGSACPLLVAVSGCGSLQDRIRSQESGFDCHLVKPASPEVVRLWLQSKCAALGA